MGSISNILLKPKTLGHFTPHEESEIIKESPKLRLKSIKPQPR